MKMLGKWNYFTQIVQIKKIDKNNLYMTCIQTEKFQYPISDAYWNSERARENSISNTVWESSLLKSL